MVNVSGVQALVKAFILGDGQIDLADKKVNQLIDEANKAKYYYDQVKGQRL